MAPVDVAGYGRPATYDLPARLRGNSWTLPGRWTVAGEKVVLEQAGGSIADRFHARDAHLVLASGSRAPIPFTVQLDGAAPGAAHGTDVDEEGNGVLREGWLYQLVRQPDRVHERLLEIRFSEAGAEAYAFTYG